MSDLTEATEKLKAHYKQWMIGPDQNGLVLPKAKFADSSSRNYALKNAAIRKCLQYEKQTMGINLGFTDDCEPKTVQKVTRWFFARNGNQSEPIKYGEKVAMGYGIEPSFVYYDERPVGINLNWSKPAKYEWQIVGGKPGTPVEARKYWAIFNSVAHEPLLHFDRSGPTGDIGWPSSRTWGQQLKELGMELAEKVAKEAAEAAVKAILSGA
ncbi:hypothetical protein [Flindersiella endophytica]